MTYWTLWEGSVSMIYGTLMDTHVKRCQHRFSPKFQKSKTTTVIASTSSWPWPTVVSQLTKLYLRPGLPPQIPVGSSPCDFLSQHNTKIKVHALQQPRLRKENFTDSDESIACTSSSKTSLWHARVFLVSFSSLLHRRPFDFDVFSCHHRCGSLFPPHHFLPLFRHGTAVPMCTRTPWPCTAPLLYGPRLFIPDNWKGRLPLLRLFLNECHQHVFEPLAIDKRRHGTLHVCANTDTRQPVHLPTLSQRLLNVTVIECSVFISFSVRSSSSHPMI